MGIPRVRKEEQREGAYLGPGSSTHNPQVSAPVPLLEFGSPNAAMNLVIGYLYVFWSEEDSDLQVLSRSSNTLWCHYLVSLGLTSKPIDSPDTSSVPS